MFYIKKNNKIVLADENRETLNITLSFMPQYEGCSILETEAGQVIKDFELINVEEAQAKEEEREREHLNMLSLTAADVERAIYKVKGLDFDDILELVKDNPDIDSKALKIELKANNFYHGNPYVSAVGTILGFTEEQLDKFFETGYYEELI